VGRCDEKGGAVGILEKRLETCTLQTLELKEVKCEKGSRLSSGIKQGYLC